MTADEAQARWRALRAFAEKNGHFLVTNGPYRLEQWNPDAVVLEAVREVTYPLGFGTFDRFVNPPRAVIETATHNAARSPSAPRGNDFKDGARLQAHEGAAVTDDHAGDLGLLVVSRYLLIGPDGKVRALDKMHWEDDGRFTIKLPERLPPGEYTVNLGYFPRRQLTWFRRPVVHFRIGGAGSPG